jgi:SNF2 family DNA or RNA helicase
MLEPQWNPTVEEQAMARVHRIGQTRPVTEIRYIMEGSIEEVSFMLLCLFILIIQLHADCCSL